MRDNYYDDYDEIENEEGEDVFGRDGSYNEIGLNESTEEAYYDNDYDDIDDDEDGFSDDAGKIDEKELFELETQFDANGGEVDANTDLDDQSIGASLKSDTLRILGKLGLDESFFKTYTIEDRFTMYKSFLDADLPESSLEYQFATQAPIYDLFVFAKWLVMKKFPKPQWEYSNADVEMIFTEEIIKGMKTYDPQKGRVGPYFGTIIHSAVYEYVNTKSSSAKMVGGTDNRILKHLNQIKSRLTSAGFVYISVGDYACELNNTNKKKCLEIARKRLEQLISMLTTVYSTSLDAIENVNETLAGNEHDNSDYRNPQSIVVEKQTRESIIKAIIRLADTQTDALAFIARFYPDSNVEPPSIQQIHDMYYSDGYLTVSNINDIFDRLKERLRKDEEFLALFNKKRTHRDTINEEVIDLKDDFDLEMGYGKDEYAPYEVRHLLRKYSFEPPEHKMFRMKVGIGMNNRRLTRTKFR